MKKFQVFTPMQYVDMMLDEAGYFGEDILATSIEIVDYGRGMGLEKIVDVFSL
ncbi:hypothetical protein [Streptococcus suis]|uniref:hypothetical protein n=1 Tax=Streptococcus suis TaxID=1307 RepID=UPI00240FF055|nr:hypothetical protein [Streptococcus suis]MDG3137017.1 hypothetical protein [Streptococcus suis]